MVFKSITDKKPYPTLFLGAPEAEAEAADAARMPLIEVYEDFQHLLDGLSGEKFIVVGRKGSGKSAFAQYINARAQSSFQLFSKFIRKTDSDLERAVQLGRPGESDIDAESFFRWMIYTNILQLFVSHPAFEESRDFDNLRDFLEHNSGYININGLEIKQLVAKHGFTVAVDKFREFFSAKFTRDIETKSERAPYFKLLPHLEETICTLLRSSIVKENDNSFVVFFDDLDIGFDANNSTSVESLVQLLRACRYVNNEVFARASVQAKAVVLLRDDVETFLSERFVDTAKMFASYSARISWYQDDYRGPDKRETDLHLRRFIDKRIRFAMKAAGLQCAQDAWSSLVRPGHLGKSSFNHVINLTLMRPRDLLLYFLPLDSGKFSYPLSIDDQRMLDRKFSEELAKELKGELSSFYSSVTIETIFKALGEIWRLRPDYQNAVQVVQRNCKDVPAGDLITDLFNRSLIGAIDKFGWASFRCRMSSSAGLGLNLDAPGKYNIIVHHGLGGYLRSRGYMPA